MQQGRVASNSGPSKQRLKDLEFKYLYFKIQKLINKKVHLSLKYEQFRQPEIKLALIKPLSTAIIELSNTASLSLKFNKVNYSIDVNQTPRFAPQPSSSTQKCSSLVVFILLLLRYEYLIQTEKNLVFFDLLSTKGTICELLAIRMLREYKSYNRINLLFSNPLKTFNTLELAILSKSKKFLSQPIVVKILDDFFNGKLIIRNYQAESDEQPLLGTQDNIINYKYTAITLHKINTRLKVVPKYLSLVINTKNMMFAAIQLTMIFNYHQNFVNGYMLETLFWIFAAFFNLEFFFKMWNINYKFLKKILWFHLDFLLVVLINIIFVLKIFYLFGRVTDQFYHEVFSVLSILLIPRNLAVFNNYAFFNLIVLGFKRMIWNMIGMFCFFLTFIVGFYICFNSLNRTRSSYDIAFDMLQIFFGFTPAVWQNWESYNSLGKAVQIGYLFLSQFIISTILAIVLSDVFAQASANIKEDFEYFKSINLVIYFKTSSLNAQHWVLNSLWVNFYKVPIVIVIMVYEIILSRFFNSEDGDKNFTFLNKELDYYNDNDLMNLEAANDDSDSSVLVRSRKASLFQPTPSKRFFSRRYSQADAHLNANSQFATSVPNYYNAAPSATPAPATLPNLVPIQSISTLGNFKSASTDSLFIGDLLNHKYGNDMAKTRVTSMKLKSVDKTSILDKLARLEEKLDKVGEIVKVAETVQEAATQDRDKQMDEALMGSSSVGDGDNNSVNLYNILEASLNDLDAINSDDSYEGSDDTLDFNTSNDAFRLE